MIVDPARFNVYSVTTSSGVSLPTTIGPYSNPALVIVTYTVDNAQVQSDSTIQDIINITGQNAIGSYSWVSFVSGMAYTASEDITISVFKSSRIFYLAPGTKAIIDQNIASGGTADVVVIQFG